MSPAPPLIRSSYQWAANAVKFKVTAGSALVPQLPKQCPMVRDFDDASRGLTTSIRFLQQADWPP